MITWRLNIMILKIHNEEIQKEMKKKTLRQMTMKTDIQNLWDAANAVIRGKIIAI